MSLFILLICFPLFFHLPNCLRLLSYFFPSLTQSLYASIYLFLSVYHSSFISFFVRPSSLSIFILFVSLSLSLSLPREGIIAELMKETDDVASRRKACKEMKELLQRALEILNEVMELSPDTVYLERMFC